MSTPNSSAQIATASRYTRSAENYPMVVQNRDRKLLACVYEYRFMLLEHIQRLFFRSRSKKVASLRLQKLWQNGYLERIFTPLVLRSGSQKAQKKTAVPIYALAEKGALEVAKYFSCERSELAWKSKHNDVGYGFIDHTLKISSFRSALTAACEEMKGCSFLFWFSEKEIKTAIVKYQAENEDKLERLRITIPDALFCLKPPDGKPEYFFLEIDLATTESKRIREKIRRYLELYQLDFFEQAMNVPHFRVLLVTTSLERMENLMSVVKSFGHCHNMFWFTVFKEESECKSAVDNITPEKILSPIWRKVWTDERYSLLD